MHRRLLGNTDVEVTAAAFGCWSIVGGVNWGEQDEADSLAALRAAHAAGVNFFDTAEWYGDGYSERLIAKALGDVRDRIVIASKVSPNHFHPKDVKAACDRSLQNLRTDRIDLYQLHWPNPDIPVADTLGAVEELREAGKILHRGVSNFGVRQLAEALEAAPDIVSNQLAYSLLFRAIEYEILPFCAEKNVSVLCYSPLQQGLLTGKFSSVEGVPEDRLRTRHFASDRPLTRHEDGGVEAEMFAALDGVRAIAESAGLSMAEAALAWLMAQPGVTSVLAGGRNASQAATNARAGDLDLAGDDADRLASVTDAVKQALGPNPDMWLPESRIR